MRNKLVAGNWKMNLAPEAGALLALRLTSIASEAEVLVCPPNLTIPAVQAALKGSSIQVGAQDVFHKPSGAYTGKISAPMLKAAGLRYCIVGHSEARGRFGVSELDAEELNLFGDSDHTVRLKIEALQSNGLTPILCVGETDAERTAGHTDMVVTNQLLSALEGLEPHDLVVAYEPVWAIGTGKTCDSAEAERVCALIRNTLATKNLRDVRVLYGGSVKAGNAAELFRQPNIDGALVGGASLDADEFIKIVAAATQ